MEAAVRVPQRVESIDWLRGLVMVLMALDHVRDYFSQVGPDPMAPDAPLALFATRWITHLCAPTFMLLAGVSAGLMAARKTRGELSRFLLSRGIWLILLECTVVTFAWKFNFTNSYEAPGINLQVIWAIGVAMIVLSALVHLPRPVVAALGIIVVAGSNLLDGLLPVSSDPIPDPLWLAIHRPILLVPSGIYVWVNYPVLAWSGLMACGYGLAALFERQGRARQRVLWALGGALLCLFLILRGMNLYGDPNPWMASSSWTHSAMSFLNVEKYPPSLQFLLVTTGAALLLLGLADRWRVPLYRHIVTFGRVPLFYYIVHLYLAHLLAMLAGTLQGYPLHAWLVGFWLKPEGYGFGLSVVYLIWIGLVVALYPVCSWYSRIKAQKHKWYLSYL